MEDETEEQRQQRVWRDRAKAQKEQWEAEQAIPRPKRWDDAPTKDSTFAARCRAERRMLQKRRTHLQKCRA